MLSKWPARHLTLETIPPKANMKRRLRELSKGALPSADNTPICNAVEEANLAPSWLHLLFNRS